MIFIIKITNQNRTSCTSYKTEAIRYFHCTVITKRFPNAFRETPLQATLDARGVRRLVIVGAMSHMCIDAGTRAAVDLGYACTVVHDACATRDQTFGEQIMPAAQVHAAFMAALGFAYARIVDTDTWLAERALG